MAEIASLTAASDNAPRASAGAAAPATLTIGSLRPRGAAHPSLGSLRRQPTYPHANTRGGSVACLALAVDALNDTVPFRSAYLLGGRTFDRAGRAHERGSQAENGGSSVQKWASFLNANCNLRRAKRHP